MPLKHFTETFLVVVLGAVLALTGLLTSTLPNLPDGALPWAALFVLTVIYPLSLYSLFQRRRADNMFRNLHWLPAIIVLLWLVLQGIAIGSSVDVESLALYTWGWTIGPVVLSFVLLVAFCLKVIRRRVPRLTFLAVILVPFAAFAFVSEQQDHHWENELASALWSADFWKLGDTGLIASLTQTGSSAEKNLDPSENPDEESWRERLRMQKSREERIAERMAERDTHSDAMMQHSSMSSSSVSSSRAMAYASVSSKPSKLPDAGFGWNVILLTMTGLYCASVHQSSRKRACSL